MEITSGGKCGKSGKFSTEFKRRKSKFYSLKGYFSIHTRRCLCFRHLRVFLCFRNLRQKVQLMPIRKIVPFGTPRCLRSFFLLIGGHSLSGKQWMNFYSKNTRFPAFFFLSWTGRDYKIKLGKVALQKRHGNLKWF